MSARRDTPRRVTPELLAFHKANAKLLRIEACSAARRTLRGWLTRILRRR
ncbi:hypothetical protein [Rhodopseudomonas sp. P2A-2r]|nr:hypothetical protein [Rhodopseudomonas sp. P2A-2r]UZE48795.1 hypothetical protein ONR75_29275 [Rhodopseudomonas sp. P2A-2r]